MSSALSLLRPGEVESGANQANAGSTFVGGRHVPFENIASLERVCEVCQSPMDLVVQVRVTSVGVVGGGG